MVSLPEWHEQYPSQERLKAEVRAAADATVQALVETIPADDLAGIYVKGSALKHWDTPIDYVPVLSDVDVHVLFADTATASTYLGSVEQGLKLSALGEGLFRAAIPEPLHVPRVQLVNANRLYDDPEFIPSPTKTVERRIGIPYPHRELDLTTARSSAIKRTLEHEDYLAKLGDAMADLFGPHLRRILRDLSWRVSPTGPRVLELLGNSFERVWSSNRTGIVRLLECSGESQLASDYVESYVQSWRYFLSQDEDGDAAREAISAAARGLSRGTEVAAAAAAAI
ncbi:MAG TPA: hypothetical protein VG815_21735 [Chloroflexota bacterium]|jgi:hypothetical protein|nr:hypothetical protein [Chloroflexota bacterium]